MNAKLKRSLLPSIPNGVPRAVTREVFPMLRFDGDIETLANGDILAAQLPVRIVISGGKVGQQTLCTPAQSLALGDFVIVSKNLFA